MMMKRCLTLTNSFFLICIVHTSFSDGYTWFEAREACQEKNDTLTLKKAKSDAYYWTGNYKRISKWIKIIGCYNETNVVGQEAQILYMVNSSVGYCQEQCSLNNYPVFAVKPGKCYCFNDYLNGSATSSQLCNYSCSNPFDNILSTECGGNGTLNVFSTGTEDFYSRVNHCLSLQCGNQSKLFQINPCSASLKAVCRGKQFQSGYAGWRKHLKNCDKYLFGKVDISNVDLSCKNVNETFGDPHWVGVVREKYLSKDRAEGTFNKKLVLMCEKCNRTSCIFTSCLQKLGNVVFCQKVEVTLPNQSATQLRTENDESLESILAPVVTIVVLGVIAGVLLFIYVRKKRQHTNNSDRRENIFSTGNKSKVKTNIESKNIEDKYTERDKKINNFALESSHRTHGIADEIIGDCSNPYNDVEEGDYDHLRGTKSRQKETDDTYNHALPIHVNDLSDYDVTRQKYDQETENTYDRTGGNNFDSEYGYNKVLPSNEESPYDKTFTTSDI